MKGWKIPLPGNSFFRGCVEQTQNSRSSIPIPAFSFMNNYDVFTLLDRAMRHAEQFGRFPFDVTGSPASIARSMAWPSTEALKRGFDMAISLSC